MKAIFSRFRFLGSELVMGSLVAILTLCTAVAGFQGAIADGDQGKANVAGQRMLTDANAEYLTANQYIVYDYSLFDGAYTAENQDKVDYYTASYSEQLQSAISTNAEDPFNDKYYETMYADAQAMFDEADQKFELAEKYNDRGDQLQFVMMVMAMALALGAWASLLHDESKLRIVFALFSIGLFVYGIIQYIAVPVVTG